MQLFIRFLLRHPSTTFFAPNCRTGRKGANISIGAHPSCAPGRARHQLPHLLPNPVRLFSRAAGGLAAAKVCIGVFGHDGTGGRDQENCCCCGPCSNLQNTYSAPTHSYSQYLHIGHEEEAAAVPLARLDAIMAKAGVSNSLRESLFAVGASYIMTERQNVG